MSSCASLLPLQLREGPIMDDVPLCPLPYTAKWQKSDRFDGELEEAVGEQRAVQGEMLAQEAATPRPAQEAATPPPTPPQDAVRGEMFRRPLVPVVEGYVDGHVRRAMEAAGDVPSMQTAPKVKVRDLPLTGAVMSRLPHYRLLPRLEGRCSCPICQEKAAEYDRLRTGAVQPDVEAAAFRDAFSEDVRAVCCLAGHLHEHQSTCFKYAPEGSRRKPQHCRFNFTHFVSLPWKDEESGATRLRVVARTGKEPKLPMWPGDSPPVPSGRIEMSAAYFRGRSTLGSRVEISRKSANRGRVVTVQFNPREGQCYCAALLSFMMLWLLVLVLCLEKQQIKKGTKKNKCQRIGRWVWHLIEVISIIRIAGARSLMALKRTV